MKAALRELDPELALFRVRTVREIVRVSLQDRSTTTRLFLLFGSLGLLIAQRRRDIGIRLSLGAMQGRVIVEVLRHGLVSTGIGLVLGALVSLALGRFLASQLFKVSPVDPWIMAASALLLCLVNLAASSIPAMRAARIDPVAALRVE